MKFRLAAIAACLLLATWVIAQESPAPAEQGDQAPAEAKEVIRHVVMFKFKPEATPEEIKKVEEAFAALPEKIDAIADFEWGTNNSPEPHAKGFTHCFVLTFDSDADRAEYLPHPAHKEFGAMLKPYIDEVMVIDYTPEK